MFGSQKWDLKYFIPIVTAALKRFKHLTLKVRNRGSVRTLTQLVFMSWPPGAGASGQVPSRSAMLSLVREASQVCRQRQGAGPVLVWSHSDIGQDPAVTWMCLDTMSRQIRASGDTNLSHYSRYLAVRHQLQLSSSQLYIQLHDMLAWAIQNNKLDNEPTSIRFI